MTTVVVGVEEIDAGLARVRGDAYRHLFRARRLARGDRLRVTDGCGRARWAEVEQVVGHQATLVLAAAAPANEPAVRLELLVAPPRPERAAWLVEKATELGAAAVRFLVCERSARLPGEGALQRLRRVARAAVEQCDRACLPEISGPHPLEELPTLLAGAERVWCLDPGGARRLAPAGSGPWRVLVGPEGGWSEGERRDLAAAGCLQASLGPRVLRIETAAVAAAARLLR
ncbi:MAG TPA: RsmE family RNA methyltransferase [Thermoanaerobaculia bacterium]|nr:RsmE family RNA methyltransferase [Thermoanaerobaculia bacterium]